MDLKMLGEIQMSALDKVKHLALVHAMGTGKRYNDALYFVLFSVEFGPQLEKLRGPGFEDVLNFTQAFELEYREYARKMRAAGMEVAECNV